MNYTEMLFNRDERLVRMLNDADNKNLELIEERNKLEDRIDKAIEILENKKHCEKLFGGVEGKTFTEEAIEILKGEDKE